MTSPTAFRFAQVAALVSLCSCSSAQQSASNTNANKSSTADSTSSAAGSTETSTGATTSSGATDASGNVGATGSTGSTGSDGSTAATAASATTPSAPPSAAVLAGANGWCEAAGKTQISAGKLAKPYAQLCANGQATTLFTSTLVNGAYTGTGTPTLTNIVPAVDANGVVSAFVGLGIKMDRTSDSFWTNVAPRPRAAH